jgi:hypothetical protein
VFRCLDGAQLNFTDQRGLAGVPLKEPEQLGIAADGFFLRMVPTRPGSTETAPQKTTLVADDVSMRCRFRFVDEHGAVVAAVKVRLRPQQQQAAAPTLPVPAAVHAGGAEAERAFSEHVKLALLLGGTGLRWQLGQQNQTLIFDLRGEDDVRFLASGIYMLEAGAADGRVGKAVFSVGRRNEDVLTVQLAPGKAIAGVVVDSKTEAPVAGAEIAVQGGDPLGARAVSDAAGRFRLAPLADGEFALAVRHDDHDSRVVGPFAAGEAAAKIALQPLGGAVLRGRVRARPDGAPVAGATVTAIDAQAQTATTTSKDDGSFVLTMSSRDDVRLSIGAVGFLAYGEIIAAKAAALDFDLWPAEPSVRLQKGLTAMFAGFVVDDHGVHQVSMPVRVQFDQPAATIELPGRRVIDGGGLLLPQVALTGSDGAFAIETAQAGPGWVFPVDGQTTPQGGSRIDAVLGKTQQIHLVAKKRT